MGVEAATKNFHNHGYALTALWLDPAYRWALLDAFSSFSIHLYPLSYFFCITDKRSPRSASLGVSPKAIISLEVAELELKLLSAQLQNPGLSHPCHAASW